MNCGGPLPHLKILAHCTISLVASKTSLLEFSDLSLTAEQ